MRRWGKTFTKILIVHFYTIVNALIPFRCQEVLEREIPYHHTFLLFVLSFLQMQ